jgi:hypothetical protein
MFAPSALSHTGDNGRGHSLSGDPFGSQHNMNYVSLSTGHFRAGAATGFSPRSFFGTRDDCRSGNDTYQRRAITPT